MISYAFIYNFLKWFQLIYFLKKYDFEISILPGRVHQKWRLHMESIQTLIIWIASCFWLKIDPFGTVYGCPAFQKKSQEVLLFTSLDDFIMDFVSGGSKSINNVTSYLELELELLSRGTR